MFLSGDRLLQVLAADRVIEPSVPTPDLTDYVRRRLGKGRVSYELALGREVFVSGRDAPIRLQEGDRVSIRPGEFAIILTDEKVHIPKNRMAMLSLRFRFSQYGLINVSGFHIDPGFEGHVMLTLYNAGASPVTLRQGEQIFNMFIVEISDPHDYKGDFEGKDHIPGATLAAMGNPVSVQNLDSRVRSVENQVRVIEVTGLGLVVAVIAAVLQLLR